MTQLDERYLGDGLYVSFDGWQVRLRAPRAEGDHFVFLEPGVLQAFFDYIEALKKGTAEKGTAEHEQN